MSAGAIPMSPKPPEVKPIDEVASELCDHAGVHDEIDRQLVCRTRSEHERILIDAIANDLAGRGEWTAAAHVRKRWGKEI